MLSYWSFHQLYLFYNLLYDQLIFKYISKNFEMPKNFMKKIINYTFIVKILKLQTMNHQRYYSYIGQ